MSNYNMPSVSFDSKSYTEAQYNVWSGYQASLPVSIQAIASLSTAINLKANGAKRYTTQIFNELDVSQSIAPLADAFSDTRYLRVSNSNMTIVLSEHGGSLLISSTLEFQSPTNISAICAKLLANMGGRLREILASNQLASITPTHIHKCQYGSSTNKSPSCYSVKDLILAGGLLDACKCKKMASRMIVATTQVSTRGMPHSYSLLLSVGSKNQLELVMAEKDNQNLVTRPEQIAGISDYREGYVFGINVARIECVYSTEWNTYDGSIYQDILVSGDSMYMANKTGLQSGMNIRPSSQWSYNRHSAIDHLTVFGFQAIASRLAKILSSNYTS